MENIVTERLIIRRFEANDWADIYEYLSMKKWLNSNLMGYSLKIRLKKKP